MTGFDDQHPPSAELIADCVHCGFCLPTCPTYLLWGEEMDSPRGRIHLMAQGLDGADLASLTPHFDACLGCLACVTACPSGVRYDRLIEATRAQVERRVRRSPAQRALREAIFALFPYPARLHRLRGLLAAYRRSALPRLARRLPAPLAAMDALLPPVRPAVTVPEFTPAVGERRARVLLLLGCVQREFFGEVNAATVRVLAAEGCDVLAPRGQGCCGALSLHSGRVAEAAGFARSLAGVVEAADVDYVVVNVAGCGSSMKSYGELLDGATGGRVAAQVRDVAELLVELGPRAVRHPVPVVVAYHDACHLSHGQGVRAQPRDLLRGIPGLELREIAEPEICCGSAGVYNVLQPEPARALGDRKAANVLATGAQLLVTANPGCLLQIDAAVRRAGTALPLAHTVELLDASIRDTGAAGLGRLPAAG